MNRIPIVIIQEPNDTKEEQQIKNINSKKYRNTKKNADLDNKRGKEYLERAKKIKEDAKQKEKEEDMKLAARDLIDSAEKYAKANAIMHGEENCQYENNNKSSKRKKKSQKETVLKSHSFDVIRKAPSNLEILSKEDAEILDEYADPAQGFYSSHTALAYGDAQPELADVEKIDSIATKLKDYVEKQEKEIEDQKKLEKLVDDLIENL
ncbi:MAG: hypothetical protein NC094_04115 [Bacteroidales bacterium]|nr:hypothetical protein [Lachnoclostridium sp.]MCM1383192.1 hypothetical protein [Lachnoclostridium sp.]MCM1464582.1 hypothetical protein [Bacteroidales bacterium]